ncbi:Piso0_000981 [Millerozyma farinosa CBS 7064]|uniref:Piso0_000981 protein n=1 Tax=Pichia sorbitophila (strain ATCC MYA-4447 / BCRC 22081 / CBS 7064 / NBRC 10061 / NRRL Y-12695) TaxID=559304 RepID=G8YS23_PICSO|nr:Piso0_000981 [Millerozyma farinosa CBS 7064]CCE78946.1 Piso0_000981 [Millerozyma farinosa CBS 7064]
MDTPFLLRLNVEKVNEQDANDSARDSIEGVRVTLKHRIRDIKYVIWYNSENFSLKPFCIAMLYNGRHLSDDESISEILGTSDIEEAKTRSINLVIDYQLLRTSNVRTRDPVEELFDIEIICNIQEGSDFSVKLRESLKCTVGFLKDTVVENFNKKVDGSRPIDRRSVKIRYLGTGRGSVIVQEGKEDCNEDNAILSDVMEIDVSPLIPILFEAAILHATAHERNDGFAYDPITASRTIGRGRLHILLRSNVPALSNGNNIFEINSSTTLREFKQMIIERVDYNSVRRTFYDQIRLYTEESTNMQDGELTEDNTKVYELLGLHDMSSSERTTYTLKLIVTDDLSGTEGGVFSRQFLRDLRSSNRFQFLPTTHNDLRNEQDGIETHHQYSTNAHDERNISPFEPTRVIMEEGQEWHLSGETYEIIDQETGVESSAANVPRSRQLLVNQSDLSTECFVISFKIPETGDEKSVTLNTSQCIVVDNNPHHQPYVLLSPSGSAKIFNSFKHADGRPIMQKVRVLIDDNISTRNDNARGNQDAQMLHHRHDRAYIILASIAQGFRRLREGIGHINPERAAAFFQAHRFFWLRTVIRYAFLIYVFGLGDILLFFWKELVITLLLTGTFYSVFVAGDRIASWIERTFELRREPHQPRRLHENALGVIAKFLRFVYRSTTGKLYYTLDTFVSFGVHRRRDYEELAFIETEQDTWNYRLEQLFVNICRDTTLFFITSLPSMKSRVVKATERWRSTENEDLSRDIETLYHELVSGLIRELSDRAKQETSPSKYLDSALGPVSMRSVLDAPSYSATSETMDSGSMTSAMQKETHYQHMLAFYLKLHKIKSNFSSFVQNIEERQSTARDERAISTDSIETSSY